MKWLNDFTGALEHAARDEHGRRRDPLTIGVTILAGLGATSISSVVATALGYAVLIGAQVGLTLLGNALLASPNTNPQDRQANLKQSIGPRLRYYGQVKVGGTVNFFETKSGTLYQSMTLNEGEIDSIVTQYMGDTEVTVDSQGRVVEEPWGASGAGDQTKVFFFYKMGTAAQTAFSKLVSTFTQVTSDFRARGTALVLTYFMEVAAEDIGKFYPNLNPPIYVVIKASKVQRTRQGDKAWSDLVGDVVYDYLTARDEAGFPYGPGYDPELIDLDTFKDYTDLCDENVPVASGGTIKRYRYWGGYSMADPMRAVLPPMLACGDADLYMTTAGKIGIRGGKWVEPALTLDATKGHIISAEFHRGRGLLAAFNELTITYTEPNLDYQATECDRWLDQDNIDLRGSVLPEKLDLVGAPDFRQARRLGKIYTEKKNPEWEGTIVTNFYGLNAIGEENANIIFPLLGINESFAINSMRILDDLSGVELQVSSFGPTAYAWDALQEGKSPTEPADTSSPPELDPPEDINVSAAARTVGGTTGTILLVTWTEPERESLSQQAQYRTSGTGTWVNMSVSDGVGLAESGIVNTGSDYDVRVRTVSPGGTPGDWGAIITIEATPDTSAPDGITDIAGVRNGSDVSLTWTQSTSLNAIGANLYRSDTFSVDGDLVATLYASPGVAMSYTDPGAPASSYYIAKPFNGSDFTEGTGTQTGAI